MKLPFGVEIDCKIDDSTNNNSEHNCNQIETFGCRNVPIDQSPLLFTESIPSMSVGHLIFNECSFFILEKKRNLHDDVIWINWTVIEIAEIEEKICIGEWQQEKYANVLPED